MSLNRHTLTEWALQVLLEELSSHARGVGLESLQSLESFTSSTPADTTSPEKASFRSKNEALSGKHHPDSEQSAEIEVEEGGEGSGAGGGHALGGGVGGMLGEAKARVGWERMREGMSGEEDGMLP